MSRLKYLRGGHASRETMFLAAVDTNNGTESQNKVLKYRYIPRTKNTSLSSIAATLVETFSQMPSTPTR